VHKASDLAGDERVIVERWLGRPLSGDETVSVNAYRPHVAPPREERDALRRRIIAQADEIGSRAQGMSEPDVDALLDEAFREARGNRG
jgi:hypothetical protein